MKRILYGLLSLAVIAAVVALILLKGPLAPVGVRTVQLARGDLQPGLFGIGTVEALRSYAVGPTRTGRLLSLAVDEGDRIQARQAIGRMDPVDLPDRIQGAQLGVEEAEHQVEAAQARLDEARSRAAQARREAKRYRELLARQQVSQEVADAKETEARTAADLVRVAQADLDAARHQLQHRHADLRALQRQLQELTLHSPVDGLVTRRAAEPGSVIVAGTRVLQIIDPTTLWVRTRIEQRGSGTLPLGTTAEIRLRTDPDHPLAGQVARLELVTDDLTEERWVDVAFERIPDGIALGTLANVTLHLPAVKNVAWLPAAALQTRDRQRDVWVVQDGRAHFKPVGTGVRTLDGRVEIRSGVAENEQVIVHMSAPLHENQRIRIEEK